MRNSGVALVLRKAELMPAGRAGSSSPGRALVRHWLVEVEACGFQDRHIG
jgi:hypothetical protein